MDRSAYFVDEDTRWSIFRYGYIDLIDMPVISEHASTTSMADFYTFYIIDIESGRVSYFFRYSIFWPSCPACIIIDIIDGHSTIWALEFESEIHIISTTSKIIPTSYYRCSDPSIGRSSARGRSTRDSRKDEVP